MISFWFLVVLHIILLVPSINIIMQFLSMCVCVLLRRDGNKYYGIRSIYEYRCCDILLCINNAYEIW